MKAPDREGKREFRERNVKSRLQGRFFPILLGVWGLNLPEVYLFWTDDMGGDYRVMNPRWNFIWMGAYQAFPFLKK